MAMTNKYKISDLAKDFNMDAKDLITILSSYSDDAKKVGSTLNEEELNFVFARLTSEHELKTLDAYFAEGAKWEEMHAKKKEAKKEVKAEEPKKEFKPSDPNPFVSKKKDKTPGAILFGLPHPKGEVKPMKDPRWELFIKTGLPQAYCYYARHKRGEQDVPDGTRTDHPQRGL